MHNKQLADELGISQEERVEIDRIHERLHDLMSRANLGVFNQSVHDAIEEYEYQLQSLWGFPLDESKHTWKHQYKFKCEWVGKRFRCQSTGEIFEIPETVRERDFYSWGEAYVDVGRLNCYSRFSNCEEILTEEFNV